jgi:hypothetical protein
MVQLTWGDALVLKIHRTRVGLKPFVDAIQAAVGKHIGTRPTFAKLYDAADVESMGEVEKYRAWLLLTAMGENPDVWGIRADVVPPASDVVRLRSVLIELVARPSAHPDGPDVSPAVTGRYMSSVRDNALLAAA